MMKKNTMSKLKKMQGCLKRNSCHLVPRLSQGMREIYSASLLLNYLNAMQIQPYNKNTPIRNLIPGQRKRFKEKNWMQNFSEILKRGRDSHLLLKMLKKMVMETTKRINRPRDRKMRKLSLKRKAMMRKKAARQRKRQSMKYFLNCKKSKKPRKNKKLTYFQIS